MKAALLISKGKVRAHMVTSGKTNRARFMLTMHLHLLKHIIQ
jgi:hypothetical protein